MGIRRPADRLPRNILKIYQDVTEDVLPKIMPSFIPTIIESTLTATEINPAGNHTISMGDSGKVICGGNGTIFIPTNDSVPLPVVTTINIITESQEYVVKAVNENVTSVYYNSNSVPGSWIIPPRTMAKLCKIETNTWNIQGENIVRY